MAESTLAALGLRRRTIDTAARRSGEQRANRFMLIVLGLQRVSYLPPTLASLGSHGYRNADLNRVLVAGTVAWNVAMFLYVRRRGWFPRWVCWADVAWAAVLITVVPWNSPPAEPYGPLNWSTRFGQAAAALAGAAIDPLIVTGAAVALLLGAHTVATIVVLGESDDLVPELISCLNGLAWFAIILGFSLRYLRRQGQTLDRLAADRLAAESQLVADQARHTVRLTHHRALHDTALATLTAIARGHLEHRSDDVRRRCAQDAAYIRRLLQDDPGDGPTTLGATLTEVIAAAEALGLRIHYRRDALPDDLPSEVVEAVGEAAREALNNVAAHAGAMTAWLTVTWEDGELAVRVVDQGAGFDPDPGRFGFGLRRSVVDRMRTAGGDARVTSAPGEGACVELTWMR